ncbi:MAG: 50S ribosome-binding GTPase [Phycisphaerales bacterium]|nr:50S ribosome-binding GTPase [Phycisphaerales bacterium]
MNATHSIETPIGGTGAIAMIRVRSSAIDAAMDKLGIGTLPIGSLRLCDLLGIDSGVVARWSDDSVMLMPHGGAAIVRAISGKLNELGIPLADTTGGAYPEADDEIESRMLGVLAHAASPLAVDLLLDQPRRWRAPHDGLADASLLGRLIEPPIVVAVGRANIGKSSLLNTIAGTRVALVADQPGTTRDHVGVAVDLAGLVVHWVDTPGIDERVADDESVTIAIGMVRQASLVLHCTDASDAHSMLDERIAAAIDGSTPVLRVLTRADQGRGAGGDTPRTSAMSGEGVAELVRAIRDDLVPPAVLDDPRPWRFWGD